TIGVTCSASTASATGEDVFDLFFHPGCRTSQACRHRGFAVGEFLGTLFGGFAHGAVTGTNAVKESADLIAQAFNRVFAPCAGIIGEVMFQLILWKCLEKVSPAG